MEHRASIVIGLTFLFFVWGMRFVAGAVQECDPDALGPSELCVLCSVFVVFPLDVIYPRVVGACAVAMDCIVAMMS